MSDSSKIKEETLEPNESNDSSKPKKKNSFVKYIFNIVIVLAVTGVTVGITFYNEGKHIVKAMDRLQWGWVFIAIAVLAVAFIFRSIIYLCFARLYTRKYHIWDAVALDQIGIFYSAVTPGASGGQFMQAYTYKKQGLPISAGASIMVMASIVYQVVLIFYGILSLSIRWDILATIPPFEITIGGNLIKLHVIPLIIIGFIVNLSVIGILFLMSYSKKFHHFMCGPMISFLAMIRIVKNKEEAQESLRIQVENFKIELRRLLSNIPLTILVAILNFIVLTGFFCIPCFVGKALGATYDLSWDLFWKTIFMSNFHQMVTGLIPIPGSAGVSELFFFQLFNGLFTTVDNVSITAAAQLIWRMITFTLPLIVGGLVSAFYHSSPKDEVMHRDINRKTFIALQEETLVEREFSMEAVSQTSRLTRQAIINKLKEKDEAEALRKQERQTKSRRLKTKVPKEKPIDESDWKEMNIGEDEEDI